MAKELCPKEFAGNTLFYEIFANAERKKSLEDNIPYHLALEITNKCAGSCNYCFSSSNLSGDIFIPTDRLLKLVDEVKEIGIKMIYWYGGEPLMHPDCFRAISYASEMGMLHTIVSSGIISKQEAKQIQELNCTGLVIHIDTIHQETYNQVHSNPLTLKTKIRGYQNILEAGFPHESVCGCITVTKPSLERIEETMDWFIDEMGASFVVLVPFKAAGYGNSMKSWEPSMSQLKKAVEYRARKLGDENFLRIGSSDASMYQCRTHIGVDFNGQVVPCLVLRDLVYGNIYQESIKDIFERSRNELLFNFEIKGFCGQECTNRDVCFGCRATAYTYTGDVQESDPKCFFNPAAREFFFQEAG